MRQGSASHRLFAIACSAMLLAGCYGPFNLTRRLHHWNGQTGGRWTNEVVFLAFLLIPVYSVATWADALVFNSLEFWTGDNPIDPPYTAAPAIKTLSMGDQTIHLERVDRLDGRDMTVQVREGDRVISQHTLEAVLDGPTVLKDAAGAVIGTAETFPDGSLVLRDADGTIQRRYSARQLDRLAKKFDAASSIQ